MDVKNPVTTKLRSCGRVEVDVLVPNSPYGLCGRKATLNPVTTELTSCGRVEVDVLVPNSPYGLCGRKATLNPVTTELTSCGRVEVDVLVPNSPYGLCGRKATLNPVTTELRSCGRVEVDVLVPNSPYGLCGRKATLNPVTTELRSCGRVEVDVLGSPSLTVRTGQCLSVDVKQHWTNGSKQSHWRGKKWLAAPFMRTETHADVITWKQMAWGQTHRVAITTRHTSISCASYHHIIVWTAALTVTSRTGISAGNGAIWIGLRGLTSTRARELCESRGGRPGLPVPNTSNTNSPYGFCGRKATFEEGFSFCASG